ncbi:RluA family pseudouridine synthase [Rhizobium alvei]|uniref:Pseudouridine synthase n=1 Tax=Rhizobium alvei TaxID=1132659 RepID=A0ABT8YLD9_9HYPH|nr:RluA family pseudouridine synthase [Rhizobium alvei]MDO6964458.1 RluA family pseudouridine synthase [Rhizobium alvei]
MTDTFSEEFDETKVLLADGDASGRLDAWLAARFAGEFSRSRMKSLIEDGHVSLNGKVVLVARQAIQPGDRIEIRLPEPENAVPRGEAIPLDILFEDEDLIVLVKPAGLVVHPGAGNWTGTLVNALIHHCGDSLSGIGGVRRPGIVHRLDKETSGVMVVAKSDLAHRGLSAQFADHGRTMKLERAYHAVIWGVPSPARGTIDAPLGRSADRVRRAVTTLSSPDARHAVTHYEVVHRYHEQGAGEALASSVHCRLETGRTHQIRVHMAHIGHPLLGDQDYGMGFQSKINRLPEPARQVVSRFKRQALHAFLLQFEHPRTGELMRFEAPLPADMAALVQALDA